MIMGSSTNCPVVRVFYFSVLGVYFDVIRPFNGQRSFLSLKEFLKFSSLQGVQCNWQNLFEFMVFFVSHDQLRFELFWTVKTAKIWGPHGWLCKALLEFTQESKKSNCGVHSVLVDNSTSLLDLGDFKRILWGSFCRVMQPTNFQIFGDICGVQLTWLTSNQEYFVWDSYSLGQGILSQYLGDLFLFYVSHVYCYLKVDVFNKNGE